MVVFFRTELNEERLAFELKYLFLSITLYLKTIKGGLQLTVGKKTFTIKMNSNPIDFQAQNKTLITLYKESIKGYVVYPYSTPSNKQRIILFSLFKNTNVQFLYELARKSQKVDISLSWCASLEFKIKLHLSGIFFYIFKILIARRK